MTAEVYFVVVVDGDPNRSSIGGNDRYLMDRYRIAQELLCNHVEGKGTICVHTSPRYRERFFCSPYVEFWQSWIDSGGELILHPEEDVYFTPDSKQDDDSYYNDPEHMEGIINARTEEMNKKKLGFSAFRGAFFGMTDQIASCLKKAGVTIDLSGAPGFILPETAANWHNAPLSGYYMSDYSYRKPSRKPEENTLFEIPLGWDGRGTDLARNYLLHERSTYMKLCKVWDAIVRRSKIEGRPQFVSFLCHTHSMRNTRLRNQCENILNYMKDNCGTAVTALEAKKVYNRSYLPEWEGQRLNTVQR